MDTRDRQIAILNCNTVAAALVGKIAFPDDNILNIIDAYETMFEAVWAKVASEIDGTNAVQRVFPGSVVVPEAEAPQPQPAYQQPAPQGVPQTPQGDLKVAGTQHGPLPAWLIKEAAAAGVTKVWDNRIDREGNDITANPANKRPWFKDADSDKAFWPPKTGRR